VYFKSVRTNYAHSVSNGVESAANNTASALSHAACSTGDATPKTATALLLVLGHDEFDGREVAVDQVSLAWNQKVCQGSKSCLLKLNSSQDVYTGWSVV